MANGNELTAKAREEIATIAPTPMVLLQMAMSQGCDLDKLTKLMDLQERWEKNEARKAYVVAMNAFKADAPVLTKNKHVKAGSAEYDHATLDNVVDTLTAALSKHGLSHAWKVEQADGKITVTCVITHEMGHSESVSLQSAADTSGSKNAIQAIASAVTYLERYTLLAATGMAAKGIDTDGVILEPWIDEFLDAIKGAGDRDECFRYYKEAVNKGLAVKNEKAIGLFIQAKDKWQKEHANGDSR